MYQCNVLIIGFLNREGDSERKERETEREKERDRDREGREGQREIKREREINTRLKKFVHLFCLVMKIFGAQTTISNNTFYFLLCTNADQQNNNQLNGDI